MHVNLFHSEKRHFWVLLLLKLEQEVLVPLHSYNELCFSARRSNDLVVSPKVNFCSKLRNFHRNVAVPEKVDFPLALHCSDNDVVSGYHACTINEDAQVEKNVQGSRNRKRLSLLLMRETKWISSKKRADPWSGATIILAYGNSTSGDGKSCLLLLRFNEKLARTSSSYYPHHVERSRRVMFRESE